MVGTYTNILTPVQIVIIDMSGIDMSLSQPQHILMASMDQGNTLAQSRCAEHMSSTAHD